MNSQPPDNEKPSVGRTISLRDYYSTYQERLQEARSYLEGVRDEIFTQMINIASAGPFKEWMREIKTGEEFYFTGEMLMSTGDKNIDALWELYWKVEEVEELLGNK
jgi:hypothetical protein